MNKFLDEQTLEQLKEVFASVENPVTILHFLQNACENCAITSQLFAELDGISDKITIVSHNIDDNPELKDEYNVTNAPSYLILNKNNKPSGAVFYGVPAGHEFTTLITNIIDASHVEDLFQKELLEQIQAINKPIDIKVFVTVSCPHCPGAAINASRLAQLNSNIKASVYETQTFGEMADKYQVSGVPKIVINETEELLGNQPIGEFIKLINNL